MIGFMCDQLQYPWYVQNIKETGYFTVNHITEDMIADAHHTSANYDDSRIWQNKSWRRI
jgi:flavin reductase (DIM6/NTAB) family NADH-FMN oxidoreductase RutF